MNKTNIAIIVYGLGLIFGALVLDMWSAETSPKALLGILWTTVFAICLYYLELMNSIASIDPIGAIILLKTFIF